MTRSSSPLRLLLHAPDEITVDAKGTASVPYLRPGGDVAILRVPWARLAAARDRFERGVRFGRRRVPWYLRWLKGPEAPVEPPVTQAVLPAVVKRTAADFRRARKVHGHLPRCRCSTCEFTANLGATMRAYNEANGVQP